MYLVIIINHLFNTFWHYITFLSIKYEINCYECLALQIIRIICKKKKNILIIIKERKQNLSMKIIDAWKQHSDIKLNWKIKKILLLEEEKEILKKKKINLFS